MNTQRTYTFQAGNCGFYRWKPRIEVHDAHGYITTYHPTEKSYKRFVALANSGQYNVQIVVEESVMWQLSRKPQMAFAFRYDADDFAEQEKMRQAWAYLDYCRQQASR